MSQKSIGIILAILILLVFVFCCHGRHSKHKKRHWQDSTYVENYEELDEDDEDEYPEETPLGAKPTDVKVALPLNYIYVTSEFGMREDPLTGKQNMHNGLDLSASGDTAVSIMPGIVADVGNNAAAGNYVTLKHGKLMMTYCHLSRVLAKKNNTVVAGSMVGITGETGRATGEHLHLTCKYEGKYIDPAIILDFVQSELGRSSDDEHQ